MSLPQVLVSPGELAVLSRSWPGARTVLSPLDDAADVSPPVDVPAAVREAMDVLVRPEASVEVTYVDGATVRTWIRCWTASGEAAALCIDEDGMALCADSTWPAAAAAGDDPGAAFAVVVSDGAAAVLAVLLDLQRQSAHAVADRGAPPSPDDPPVVAEPAYVEGILGAVGRPDRASAAVADLLGEPGWVATWMLATAQTPTALEAAAVEAAVDELVEAGLVERLDEGIALSEAPRGVAERLLVPTALAFVTTRRRHDDEVLEDAFVACVAGTAAVGMVTSPDEPGRTWVGGGGAGMGSRIAQRAAEAPVLLGDLLVPPLHRAGG